MFLQRGPFFQRLLNPVLTEHTLASLDDGHDIRRGKCFGNADERHVLRIARRIARGAGDAGAHIREAVEACFRLFQSSGFQLSVMKPRGSTVANVLVMVALLPTHFHS